VLLGHIKGKTAMAVGKGLTLETDACGLVGGKRRRVKKKVRESGLPIEKFVLLKSEAEKKGLS